jgi:hypothetical protein
MCDKEISRAYFRDRYEPTHWKVCWTSRLSWTLVKVNDTKGNRTSVVRLVDIQCSYWSIISLKYVGDSSASLLLVQQFPKYKRLIVLPGSSVSTVPTTDWTTGSRSPTDAIVLYYSLCVQTGSGAHPTPCIMGAWDLSVGLKGGRGVMLTTQFPFTAKGEKVLEPYLLSPQTPPGLIAGQLYFSMTTVVPNSSTAQRKESSNCLSKLKKTEFCTCAVELYVPVVRWYGGIPPRILNRYLVEDSFTYPFTVQETGWTQSLRVLCGEEKSQSSHGRQFVA